MHFHIILNRQGGTLRTLDVDAFAAKSKATLEEAGHTVSTLTVDGKKIEEALTQAVEGPADVIMVGGGDGTVSAAAGKLMNTSKALAILPAGTMNLFARSLAIPLQLETAVNAFAGGEIRSVDLARANDRVFVHQFSVGLHAKLIELREKAEFRSRLGKIWASARAGLNALFRPPNLKVTLEMDDEMVEVATTGVGISNNPFGEGHLPYADMPDKGVLGVYVTRAWRKRDMALFALKMAMGQWKTNPHVDIYQSRKVTLKLKSKPKRFGCAIDGELCDLDGSTRIEILPGALKVLVAPE
ncbi:diacylglycerol kinase family protein [Mesorhizobium sp. CAU 1741]|uniref:diacylglycerol/lipid kinase family protein n=1 Tax=Mesorhizobium sp. CAU 1741 TaxID=3140366 RepID=UPI00325BB4FD